MGKLHNAGKKSKGVDKRKRDKHAGLKQENHPRIRHEYLDIDYVRDLTDKEKTYLAGFLDEYYGASLAPADEPKEWRKNLHKSKKQRKKCMDRNNALNRDMYAQAKMRGFIDPTELQTVEKPTNPGATEDNVIQLLDIKINGEDN